MHNDIGDTLGLTFWGTVVVVCLTVVAYRGCGKVQEQNVREQESSLRSRELVGKVRIECLKAGHSPLECKELQ